MTMQPSQHVIIVSEADFQYEVLSHSSQQAVVVDFWAEWCAPCRTLGPILEKLAEEAAGTFRLAKLDVDANSKIAMDYGVRGIPAVKAFRNGQVVAEFSGLRSEEQIRTFLNSLIATPNDLTVGKANSLLTSEKWQEAEQHFREVLDGNPDHPGALLGLAKCLLAQGEPTSALPILREFPVSKEYSTAEQLIPLAQAMADKEDSSEKEIGDKNPHEALYENALRLAGRGQIAAALDGLLEILRQDKNYRKGQGRKVAVGLLHLLGENNPLAREYRTELASLIF